MAEQQLLWMRERGNLQSTDSAADRFKGSETWRKIFTVDNWDINLNTPVWLWYIWTHVWLRAFESIKWNNGKHIANRKRIIIVRVPEKRQLDVCDVHVQQWQYYNTWSLAIMTVTFGPHWKKKTLLNLQSFNWKTYSNDELYE